MLRLLLAENVNVEPLLIVLLCTPSLIVTAVLMSAEVTDKIRPLAPYWITGILVVEPTVPAVKPSTSFRDALSVTLFVPSKSTESAEMSPPEMLKFCALARYTAALAVPSILPIMFAVI